MALRSSFLLFFFLAAPAVAALNDTGLSDFFWQRGGGMVNEPMAWPGQDGRFGRDAAAQAGVLVKSGAGDGGFDFSPLDGAGQPLAGGEAACVLDHASGLVWEAKTRDGGWRDQGRTFRWASAAGPAVCTDPVLAGCSTADYVQAANGSGLCGFRDWRVPTLAELQSLPNYSRAEPAVDITHFPNTVAAPYWSATALAAVPGYAWYVDFSKGGAYFDQERTPHALRLVRGETGIGGLGLRSDGTLEDSRTGLIWRACPLGQSQGAGGCGGVAEAMDWPGALAAVAALNKEGYAGFRDWRLPNVRELASLVDSARSGSVVDPLLVPGSATGGYWSSTGFVSQGRMAWTVDFRAGYVNPLDQSKSGGALAVRGGLGEAGYDNGGVADAVACPEPPFAAESLIPTDIQWKLDGGYLSWRATYAAPFPTSSLRCRPGSGPTLRLRGLPGLPEEQPLESRIVYDGGAYRSLVLDGVQPVSAGVAAVVSGDTVTGHIALDALARAGGGTPGAGEVLWVDYLFHSQGAGEAACAGDNPLCSLGPATPALPGTTWASIFTVSPPVAAFGFAPAVDVPPDSPVASGMVRLGGEGDVTVVGGEFRLDYGPWRQGGAHFADGQLLQLRVRTPAAFAASVEAEVHVGSYRAAFRATTLGAASVAAAGDLVAGGEGLPVVLGAVLGLPTATALSFLPSAPDGGTLILAAGYPVALLAGGGRLDWQAADSFALLQSRALGVERVPELVAGTARVAAAGVGQLLAVHSGGVGVSAVVAQANPTIVQLRQGGAGWQEVAVERGTVTVAGVPVLAGEVATLRQGALVGVRLGSLWGGLTGDPLAYHEFYLGDPVAIPILAGSSPRLGGQTLLAALAKPLGLAADTNLDQNAWGTLERVDGGGNASSLWLLPLGQVAVGLPGEAHLPWVNPSACLHPLRPLEAGGLATILCNVALFYAPTEVPVDAGTVAMLVASYGNDLAAAEQNLALLDPYASISIAGNGVVAANLSSGAIVPVSSPEPQVPVCFPAFLDSAAVEAIFREALADSSLSIAAMEAGAYVAHIPSLALDLSLYPDSETVVLQGETRTWWQTEADHLYVNYGGGVGQGFRFSLP